MQFAPDFAQEIEVVEIIEASRLGGVDVLASGVRMLILPLQRTPQEIAQSGRAPYTPRFGCVLESPHNEIKRNRQIRRSDNSVYNVVEVYEALGEMQAVLESEGTP